MSGSTAVVGHLAGVGIEAVIGGGGVEHARSQMRQMGLHDIPHVLGHIIVAILHRRGIVHRRRAEDVSPFKASRPVWAKYDSTGSLPSIGE